MVISFHCVATARVLLVYGARHRSYNCLTCLLELAGLFNEYADQNKYHSIIHSTTCSIMKVSSYFTGVNNQ